MRGEAGLREIAERALRISPAEETQVTLTATTSALTRFANSVIHQNTAEEERTLTVRARVGHRVARAMTNRLDQAGIADAVHRACELARVAPVTPDLPRLPGPQRYRTPAASQRRARMMAGLSPMAASRLVAAALRPVARRGGTAAGYLSVATTTVVIANSRGLFATAPLADAECSVTVQVEDGTGWAKAVAPTVSQLSIPSLIRRALTKAVVGRRPRDIEPGTYPVVLEPAAVVDLLAFLAHDFSGEAVLEQWSALTGQLGRRLFAPSITLTDDLSHPLHWGLPFDAEGLPRQRVRLIERGAVKRLVYSLDTATRMKTKPTGHGLPTGGEAPSHLVLSGGRASLESLVRGIRRGLLITRFWYIREVETHRKLLTGMTRDGTFWIENGRVAYPVKNLRFNQSVFTLLGEVTGLGQSVRAAGEEYDGSMVVPPLAAKRFVFTAVTP